VSTKDRAETYNDQGDDVNLKLGQCCISWGVEEPEDASITPWQTYLDESATAGYHGVELGPIGYLPTDHEQLRKELDDRGLRLCAGYVMEPLVEADALTATLEVAHSTAKTLAELGAQRLVLIDDMYPERTAVAGISDAAPRLDEQRFETLVSAAHEVARIASEEFGLIVAFHPHAGSYVEFRDEIDRFLEATDPTLIRLCIDSGHSVYAGVDPVALFDAYPDRVGYMHLKDVDLAVRERIAAENLSFDDAVAQGIFCPLGRGAVDYPGLFSRMRASGYEGWVSVEQDRLPKLEQGERASFIGDARESFEYIESAGYTTRRDEAVR
jgi:inosose dehydratase